MFILSVATTSTKPPPVIKADIKRVLDRMQVQYRESKGGFECIHLPSIDVTSVQDTPPTPSRGHRKQASSGSNDATPPRRSIVKKSSKLSFDLGTRDRPKSAEKEKDKDKDKDKDKLGKKERDALMFRLGVLTVQRVDAQRAYDDARYRARDL